MIDQPDWNTWFSYIRLGLWTDTTYYTDIAKGKPVGPPKQRDIAWMPFHGFHHFIAGETGYGKSNTERVILKELWPGIRAGAVEIIGFDAQLGVELQPVAEAGLLKEFYFGKGTGEYTEDFPKKKFPNGKPYEATFAEALEKHVYIMRERTEEMKKLGVNEWTISKEKPARVILIDEAGQLFRPNIAKTIRDRVIGAIDTLTFQSRKCGYVVVACTQLANVDAIPVRHGLTFGVAHRMGSQLGYFQVTKNSMDMPPLPRGKAGKGLAYMSGHQKRILKTQRIDRLEKLREPIVVNVDRMPAYEEPPAAISSRVSVSGVGVVDAVTGEVLDSESGYDWYEQMSEYR